MEANVSGVAAELITLIRKALCENAPVTEMTDVDEARRIIEYASAQGLLMFLNEYEYFREILRGKDYFKLTMADVYLRTHQTQELKKLLDAFEENQISCVVLKGARTRELYLKSEWRSMGDIDLLYRPEQTRQLKKVMRSLGYESKGNTAKHDHYQKGAVTVEMHKTLCVPEWKESRYFADVWDRVQPWQEYGHVFCMSMEDHYLFTVTHLLEHFLSGGIGIRMVLDVHILSQRDDINWDYVDDVLSGMGYEKFYGYVKRLAQLWFAKNSDEPMPEALKELETYILHGGIFGNLENDRMNMQLKYEGRLHFLRKIVFPDYQTMKIVYPWLNCRLLLPVAWIIRGIQAVLRRRTNVKIQMERAQAFGMAEKELKKRKKFFESIGLGGS